MLPTQRRGAEGGGSCAYYCRLPACQENRRPSRLNSASLWGSRTRPSLMSIAGGTSSLTSLQPMRALRVLTPTGWMFCGVGRKNVSLGDTHDEGPRGHKKMRRLFRATFKLGTSSHYRCPNSAGDGRDDDEEEDDDDDDDDDVTMIVMMMMMMIMMMMMMMVVVMVMMMMMVVVVVMMMMMMMRMMTTMMMMMMMMVVMILQGLIERKGLIEKKEAQVAMMTLMVVVMMMMVVVAVEVEVVAVVAVVAVLMMMMMMRRRRRMAEIVMRTTTKWLGGHIERGEGGGDPFHCGSPLAEALRLSQCLAAP